MASVPPPDYNPASLLPNVAADITTIRGGGFSLDYIGGAGLNTSTMITHTSTNSFITVSKEPYELTDPRVKPVRTKPVPGFEEAMLITGDKAKVAQLDTKVITGLSNESIDPICLTDKGVILNSRCAAHSAASAAALGRIVKDDIKKENAKTNYFEEFELSKKPSDFKATTSRKIVDMRYDTDKKQLFLDYEDGDKFYRFYGRNAESLLELLNNKFSAKANAGVGDKPNGKNKTLTVTPKPPAPPGGTPPPPGGTPPAPPPPPPPPPADELVKLKSDLDSLIVKYDGYINKYESKENTKDIKKEEIDGEFKTLKDSIATKSLKDDKDIKSKIGIITAQISYIDALQKNVHTALLTRLKITLKVAKSNKTKSMARGGKRNSTQKRRGSKIDL